MAWQRPISIWLCGPFPGGLSGEKCLGPAPCVRPFCAATHSTRPAAWSAGLRLVSIPARRTDLATGSIVALKPLAHDVFRQRFDTALPAPLFSFFHAPRPGFPARLYLAGFAVALRDRGLDRARFSSSPYRLDHRSLQCHRNPGIAA